MERKPETPANKMKRHAKDAAGMMKQLANPKRLLILCQLLSDEKPVGELAEEVGLSQSALSQHLAKMREAGLIEADKRGQMVYYRLRSMEANALLSTLYLIYCRD
jgi:ArsR family transcriptional regulator, virulence genes transcriptional regulator